jgi:hypothetical protein
MQIYLINKNENKLGAEKLFTNKCGKPESLLKIIFTIQRHVEKYFFFEIVLNKGIARNGFLIVSQPFYI